MSRSTPFIRGESIDLCVPDDLDIEQWASWFNDPEITRYLDQGLFPHSPTQQYDFLESLRQNERFSVLIREKQSHDLMGIVSLSTINFVRHSAQIAIVAPNLHKNAPLGPLEAVARVTEHGFETLGLRRIWAGQAWPGLSGWNQDLEVVGYRAEGFLRDGFIKGRTVQDVVRIAVHIDDYLELKKSRGGTLWPGTDKMRRILRRLPANNNSLAFEIARTIKRLHRKHAKFLTKIESEEN